NRAETARLLSREAGSYTPHPEAVLRRVLVQYDPVFYNKEGAIQHPQWKVARIDFQPYPFPSYTQLLVRLLQRTQVEGDRDFLRTLNAQTVSRDLVDDRFVRKAIAAVGGAKAFGLPANLLRQEAFAP
ncbi:MAG: ABC transporter substrate-binding protein, partial [bacterium]|nr:ABC transporter substrate-binding protein [bacterium]